MATPLEKSIPSYPTPNIQDLVLVEYEDPQKCNYNGLENAVKDYGKAHPDTTRFPSYKLTFQEPVDSSNGQDKLIKRVWVKDRNGQDAYNAQIKWVDEDDGYPIYTRTYLTPRLTYTRGTDLDPLRGIIGLTLTNGGTGYTGDGFGRIDLIFTGGAGSGAAGYGIVSSGVITLVYLTNSGSGYTSAPTVSAAGGAGLAVTALLQSTSAKLIHEESAPAPEPYGSLYLIVTRVFKTLPGPWVYSLEPKASGDMLRTGERWNIQGTVPSVGANYVSSSVKGVTALEVKEFIEQLVQSDGSTVVPTTSDVGETFRWTDKPTGAMGGTTVRLRPYGTTLPALSSAFQTGYIFDVEEKEIKGSTNVVQIIRWMEIPDPWLEYPEVSITFPGISRFSSWSALTNYGGQFPPPWPGDGVTSGTYYLLHPRQRKVQGRLINSFTLGASGKAQQGYYVYTPGVASKVLRIPDNTVHGPIVVTETISGDPSSPYTVENIPASTPSTYQTTQILTFPGGEERYKQVFYWNKVLQVSEATNPYYFPDVYQSDFFTFDSTSNGDLELEGQPNPGGERLSLVSDGADTRVVTIYGQRNNSDGIHYTKENVTLTGTTVVRTDATYDWYIFQQAHTSTNASRTITVRGEGTDAEGSITASGVPTDGEFFEAGKTGSTNVYTFRRPARVLIGCPGSAGLNPPGAGSYVSLTLAGVAHYFWFDVNTTNTDPAPGGTGHEVDVGAADTDVQVAAALRAKILADIPTIWFSEVGGNTVTLTGINLGASSISQNAAQFTITVTAAGTAQVANQIRTGWNVAGVALTSINIASYIDQTFDLDGTSGQTYSTATAAHPDLTASIDLADTSTVILRSRLPQSYGTWVLTESSSSLSVVAITDGSNGQLIATITPNETDAYNNFITDNTTLVLTGAGWTPEESNAYGAIVVNFPGQVGQLVSEVIQISIPVGQTPVKLRLIAQGTPSLPVDYQTSVDGISWSAGLTALSSVGNSRLYDYELAETSIEYIRIRVTNNNATARALHAEVFTRVNIG